MRSVHFLVWLSMNALASFLILFYCFLQTSADTKKSSKKLSNVRETERCTALPERPPPGSDDLWILQPSLARTCVILRLFAPLCLQSHRSWCFLVEVFSILVTVFLLVPLVSCFCFLLVTSFSDSPLFFLADQCSHGKALQEALKVRHSVKVSVCSLFVLPSLVGDQ